jgi:hypothetical protein
MKKIFISLILAIVLFAGGNAFSQNVSIDERFYNAGIGFLGYTAVDTLNTTQYTTSFFDISLIDGQTMYFTYDYYTPATTGADTLYVIVQSKVGDATGSMTFNLDTLTIVSNITANTPSQTTFSFTSYHPTCRLIIRPNYYGIAGAPLQTSRDGTLRFFIYARVNDTVDKMNKSWY